ncbi:GH25 family lysozyme [Botrimarina hoheduenensis]|uniref:GH25 family lysozyme n=1 Tax=Botrimarina hoheduenensis TaxID=2528000 RepID=UPI001E49E606|nr:GH25 family lysozyme [Botrimarina hoheduenensis]
MAATLPCLAATLLVPAIAVGQRSLGIDVSAWQGNISQSEWNQLRNNNNREFVFIRSSRGGTTGFYNQNDANNNQGNNTLSQRYDDPYFVQNITRATSVGMLAGPYHFSRPDIVASTLNSGGIANTGTDEANHFIQMAGAWMRPGYLLPVFDLEAGDGIRTDQQITQYSIDFSNRIYEVTGVRPIMYINGNYAAFVVQSPIQDYFPVLWTARYANQSDPDSIPVQTGHPKDTFSQFYGPWDTPADPHPWDFWQYASTARLSGYRNGGANLDVNVAQGGPEFLKDNLVPALWVSGSNGAWSTLSNWNSGQAPVAPVQGPGQGTRVGPLTLPAARLPGPLDTVILDRTAENVTVTIDGGVHEVRKLVAREALTLSGGSLTVNYTPVAESTPYSAQFSAPVSLAVGSLSAHTLLIDAVQTFTISGGELTFDRVNLTPHSLVPASIAISGNTTFSPWGTTTATIGRGIGTGTSGTVSLTNGSRTLTVNDGAAEVDVSIDAEITAGSLVKQGDGVLRLTAANTHSGTFVTGGKLLVENTTGSGTGLGPVAVLAGATLGGSGAVAGPTLIDGTLAPGASIGTLTIASVEMRAGSKLEIEIDSAVSYDQLTLLGALTVDPSATIEVTFGAGYTPAFGDSFAIVGGASNVTGEFGSVVSSGPALVARNVAGGVVLEVLSGLPGDYNNDGSVDAADYTVWSNNYGQSATNLLNTNGAGEVDASYYTVWRDNLGASLPTTASAVPEPGSLALAMLMGMAFATQRRGQ